MPTQTIEEIEARRARSGRADWIEGEGDGGRTMSQHLMRREAAGRRASRPRSASGLGWFSIGLGAAQLLAPRQIARFVGVRDSDAIALVMRALGARDLASGLGLLRSERPARWLWARAGGDAVDLALLGAAMGTRCADQDRLSAATAAVAGVTVLDVLAARAVARAPEAKAGVEVVRSITINRTPDEVYRFWRALENLPSFMAHLDTVEEIADRRSRWVVRGPVGVKLEWEAEMTADIPGERIAWCSLEGADVDSAGEVTFAPAPGDRGTEVRVALHYRAPAGRVGTAVAKIFGKEPAQQIAGDLRRLKQVMETGEVVHSDASIHRGPHPARPSGARGGRKGGA